MIVQDAPKLEARIRRKCGLEAGNNPHREQDGDNNEEHDEEGQSLLSPVDMCERDIDLALVETTKDEQEQELPGDELDETI